jgi:hypothetical protein
MTYPYGTKGAPVVGNGLGGLPRRAVATAAAVAAGPRLFERIGDAVTTTTSVGNPGLPVLWGRIIGDSPGKMFFKNARLFFDPNTGGNSAVYIISGAQYSDSGVISSLSESQFGTNITPSSWSELSFFNSWSADTSAYYYNRQDNNIVRISAPSTSLSRTTVKSTAIPLSGTTTVSSASYTIYDANTSRIIGDNTTNTPVHTQALPGGNVLIIRSAIISNHIWLVGFVFDSAFNIVRSFPITAINNQQSSAINRIMLVLPVTGSTDLFSVFSICGNGTSAQVLSRSATFNWTDGAVSSVSVTLTSAISNSNWLGGATYIHTDSALIVTFNDASTSTRRVVFPINNDFSVVNDATQVMSIVNSSSFTIMPNFRTYDPQNRDYYSTGVNPSLLEPLITAAGNSLFFNAVPTLQEPTIFNYSVSPATAGIVTLSAKGVTATQNENSSIADAPGQGPYALARVSPNSYIGVFYDANTGSNSTTLRAQLMRLPS